MGVEATRSIRQAEIDRHTCPEDHELKQFRRNYSDTNREPTGKDVAEYHGLKLTCPARPSNMNFLSFIREKHEDARQVARDIASTEQYEVAMKLTKNVELFSAHQLVAVIPCMFGRPFLVQRSLTGSPFVADFRSGQADRAT